MLHTYSSYTFCLFGTDLEHFRNSGLTDIEKFTSLCDLQHRNETLFYRVIIDNIKEMAPIVYTPTGSFSLTLAPLDLATSPARSLAFLSPQWVSLVKISVQVFGNHEECSLGSMTVASVSQWSTIGRVTKLTSSSSLMALASSVLPSLSLPPLLKVVVGLGDLGVQGMAISVGKLVLYTAAGGIHPAKALPICIDAGSKTGQRACLTCPHGSLFPPSSIPPSLFLTVANNIALLNSPVYIGTPVTRGNDKDYFELMDEFMEAIYERSDLRFPPSLSHSLPLSRWPQVLVQFEDIQNERAVALLKKYQKKRLCFNDDIQGTGAVTVAGTRLPLPFSL
jgi:hypothetical protein